MSCAILWAMTQPTEPTAARYEVIDRQTQLRVAGPYVTRAAARRKVDVLDNEYGAYRYFVRAVEESR